MSDRIAVMNAGRIQQIDAPQTIYHQPRTGFVAEFMGEANLLSGTDCLGPDGEALSPSACVMVRAENFHLDAASCGPDRLSVTGVLDSKAFRGENWLINLTLPSGQTATLSIPSTRSQGCDALTTGQRVQAFADLRHVHTIPAAHAA